MPKSLGKDLENCFRISLDNQKTEFIILSFAQYIVRTCLRHVDRAQKRFTGAGYQILNELIA